MSDPSIRQGLHIAIVGYGSSALMLLKSLQDLPQELREDWRVTVFERREGLGGQWYFWLFKKALCPKLTSYAGFQTILPRIHARRSL